MALRTSSSMPTTSVAGTTVTSAAARGAGARELALERRGEAHEQQLDPGMGGEEVEAGRHRDGRAVVPAHRVDGDDGLHGKQRGRAAPQSLDWITFLPR